MRFPTMWYVQPAFPKYFRGADSSRLILFFYNIIKVTSGYTIKALVARTRNIFSTTIVVQIEIT